MCGYKNSRFNRIIFTVRDFFGSALVPDSLMLFLISVRSDLTFFFFDLILCNSQLSLTNENIRTRTYNIIKCSNRFIAISLLTFSAD